MKLFGMLIFSAGIQASALLGGPADDLTKQARSATKERRYDEAIALCEKVIIDHPEATNLWFAAQLAIAENLALKGDLDAAAKATHLALIAASDAATFDRAVMLAAQILSALDGNVERANRFLQFQMLGPAADRTNPLAEVGFPPVTDREPAFAAMRQDVGDSTTASRLRAWTYLLSGQPRLALAHCADQFRRAETTQELQRAATDLVAAQRAAVGHRLDQKTTLQFIIHGPSGPDGVPATADDLGDPFAAHMPEPPSPCEGGLAGLSAEDLDALRQVRDAARTYVSDTSLPSEVRRSALAALKRAKNALDDWGTPDEREWFLDLGLRPNDDSLNNLILLCTQMAIRNRQLHLAGPQEMWKNLDALCASQGITVTKQMSDVRTKFERTCEELSKLPYGAPSWKPLDKAVEFHASAK